ncbi:Nramp family divalent metal transporter [Jiella sp. MQZ9-1]|uniref:Divalent metal cation transporter MntH n=1 Tax=Jiella flava TaxID=2816857 RepID=A0A939G0N2_9HYPH|nr:Nramp family divalent metal transporter [Jiella flava]MBO0664329.1 Nramp family divalent metal transporter [Jiella flava]MCD2472748.1 Nramp family divalent metal transporter [Jiella flava]
MRAGDWGADVKGAAGVLGQEGSLDESFRSVAVGGRNPFRRFLAFLGPGFLVAVGYMDPGNWATSIAGGSQFGYTLLAAVLLSSLMAIVLQALCARFAIATGRDLAEACRDYFPRWVSVPLWVLAELAIVATDLAEVIGTAIGLQLLFGLPLVWGVVVTALDVFLILYLQTKGFRRLEAFVAAMILVIAACFLGQLILAEPSVAAIVGGLIPTPQIVTDNQMLYLALGILGATVMPHNLYLHTGVVHTRAYPLDEAGREQAIRYATLDSTAALSFAFLVNAAILILAAAAFYKAGHGVVEDLSDAHALLRPLLGSALAPILFAVALLASGLSSTVTATLAGQIVMQGFLRLRMSPVVRRLITRGLAILPAAAVIVAYGEKGAAELLVLSQVVLSLQLPFAVVPLVMFSARSRHMGPHRPPLWLLLLSGVIAVMIIVLNAKLVFDFVSGGF